MNNLKEVVQLTFYVILFTKICFMQGIDRSNHSEVFYEKVLLKVLQNSLESTFVGVSFLIKLQTLGLQHY